MMHITIVTAGSRGDTQPYVALGKALLAAGHHVRLATHDYYREWVESHGMEHAIISGDVHRVREADITKTWVESGRSGLAFVRHFRLIVREVLNAAVRDTYEASQGADLIIASSLAYHAVHSAAEKTSIPWVQTYLQPIHPTTAFPSTLFPLRVRLGGWANRASGVAGGQLFWQMMRGPYNAARREVLDLPPYPLFGPVPEVEKQRVPALYAFSPSFIPKPKDWPGHAHVVGYWFLEAEADWQPPSELRAFLAAGDPPVSVGFGSMVNRDPEATTRIVVEALQEAGQRGVLITGWGRIGEMTLPDTIFTIDSVPHDWLFPRMAAVVHHGGAGTTAAGLRAGVPSILVPFFGDQPWWGDRVLEAGVGPQAIPRKELTVERLARAIDTAVTHQPLRERAARLGERIRAEDGTSEAVRLIENYRPVKQSFA